MKRSEINRAFRDASACFRAHHWSLPPLPRWDITDFGLGDFSRYGLALVNLATEPEYCEKLMYSRRGQTTPCHAHARKKEDIICRVGQLLVRVWPGRPEPADLRLVGAAAFQVQVNGAGQTILPGETLPLEAGSRITLFPGTWHEFQPGSPECIIGEVSTANDDLHDNFFVDDRVGRFAQVEEDEPPLVKLVSD